MNDNTDMENNKSIVRYRNKVEHNLLFKIKTLLAVKRELNKAISSIDEKKLSAIIQKYKDFDPAPGYSKYLDIKPWMLDNVWRAHLLRLNLKKPSKNVLDIGTGNGYFPFICKQFGHIVRTIDIGFNPIFNELIQLLEIPRIEYAVKAFEPIPAFDLKFDIVTAFHIYFNGHRTQNLWTWNEWEFFFKDLKTNHCNPDAEVFLILNREHDTKRSYTPELKEYFLSKGAEIDEDRVFFSNLNAF
ncbi:MAG: hypothetical protein WCM76_01000 [Bacteroidota bacterium]